MNLLVIVLERVYGPTCLSGRLNKAVGVWNVHQSFWQFRFLSLS